MIQKFIEHLNQFIKLEKEEELFLRKTLKIKQFSKREIILREGQVSTAFYFILSGFIRLFYLKKEAEKTAWFYPATSFVSAYESFVKQKPSKLNLQATEKTIVVEISLASSQKLLQFSNKFEALARIAMEDELIALQNMLAAQLTLTPEERYYKLMEEHASFFQNVPQHYIASYIGVQPESLSRIKRRHSHKLNDKKS